MNPMRFLFALVSTAAVYAATLDSGLFSRLEYRSIGPTSMGGRICDVAGIPGDIATVYAASCSGGLWKTSNGGVTWTPIFEDQPVLSIGAIAVDPKNPAVIWWARAKQMRATAGRLATASPNRSMAGKHGATWGCRIRAASLASLSIG